MRKKNIHLLLFILLASCTLITINIYTIKILSGVRAYINGESEYSKGQKDALIYLYAYIDAEDPVYRQSFNESIRVPMADNLARKSLISKESDEIVGKHFLAGRNHPDDIPDMIWLFKTFRTTYMATPIKLWTEAEPLINQLYNIGNQIDEKIRSHTLSAQEKRAAVERISSISGQLYQKESEFSKVLGNTARKINGYLALANILCVLIIVGSIAAYATHMIRRLSNTNKDLQIKNKEFIEASKELDTLVYSVSHDLRSPITSIKGLLNLLREEGDLHKLKDYAQLLDSTIDKQDSYILEIISFFKNKRSSLVFTSFSLKSLIGDVIASHEYAPAAREIEITKDIATDIIHSDELRVKTIVNNLVSNAIKYSDERKSNRKINIKTTTQNGYVVIEVADNGIGIDKKNIDKIFNMFFVTYNADKGTGLGLYILKQNTEKLKGKVDVQSELNVGTTFTISLPVIGAKGESN
jgi:signal transduction histidine kinase